MVSIIMPVYNAEYYIRDTIKSVLNQTYMDFELIIVNDGSTDNSGKICEEFAKNDNRIKLIHQKNGGLSNARYSGLCNSSGEWIMFIDNDDIIYIKILELMVNLIDDDIDVISCNRVDLEDKSINDYIWDEQSEIVFNKYNGAYVCNNIEKLLANKSGLVTPLWGKIYRRKLLQKCNPLQYKKICPTIYFEDVLLTPIILGEANKIILINKVMYIHRELKTSISRSGNFTSFNVEQTYSGEIVLNYLGKKNYYEVYNYKLYDYYRVILRNYLLISDMDIGNEKKKILRREIEERYNKFYKDFRKLKNINIRNYMIVKLFKINKSVWLIMSALFYKKGKLRFGKLD